MSPQPLIHKPLPQSIGKTTGERMHAIRNQLGLIAGHAHLLLAESAPGSQSHQSAEIISRACFSVSEQLQKLTAEVPDKKVKDPD